MYRCVLSGGAIAGSVVIEAGLARGEVDLAVIADVEIEVSIPVIVEKAGAGAEARVIDSGLGGDLRKGEAFFCAVVAVEMVSPEARDIDVKVSIGVVVTRPAADGKPPGFKAFLPGHVLEGSVSPIAVERVGGAGRKVFRWGQGAAVEEVGKEACGDVIRRFHNLGRFKISGL